MPLAKLYTSKHSLAVISECMECLGGNGYMEDATDLPAILRTQQVRSYTLSIRKLFER